MQRSEISLNLFGAYLCEKNGKKSSSRHVDGRKSRANYRFGVAEALLISPTDTINQPRQNSPSSRLPSDTTFIHRSRNILTLTGALFCGEATGFARFTAKRFYFRRRRQSKWQRLVPRYQIPPWKRPPRLTMGSLRAALEPPSSSFDDKFEYRSEHDSNLKIFLGIKSEAFWKSWDPFLLALKFWKAFISSWKSWTALRVAMDFDECSVSLVVSVTKTAYHTDIEESSES